MGLYVSDHESINSSRITLKISVASFCKAVQFSNSVFLSIGSVNNVTRKQI